MALQKNNFGTFTTLKKFQLDPSLSSRGSGKTPVPRRQSGLHWFPINVRTVPVATIAERLRQGLCPEPWGDGREVKTSRPVHIKCSTPT